MADDLIYCPSCQYKLQLPPELYGQTVECPQCHVRFVAPVPQAAPAVVRPVQAAPAYAVPDYDPNYANDRHAVVWRAASSVRAPATALLIVAVLSILCNILGLLWVVAAKSNPQAFELGMRNALDDNPDLSPQDRAKIEEMVTLDKVATFLNYDCGGSLILNFVTVLGAIMMMRLRGYGLAMLGCIFALNPANMPCCLLQAPFGLWAMIVLFNGEVRRAFQ